MDKRLREHQPIKIKEINNDHHSTRCFTCRLNAVTRASLKSSLAAFSLVRLDVKTDGILRLSCFNGETAARSITNVVCDEDLSVSVDAQTLKAVVETLANEIRLMIEHNSLIIQSSIQSHHPAHRGRTSSLSSAMKACRPSQPFHGTTFRSLSRALPFASADSSRFVLQVLHLTFDTETVIAQTADGYSAGYVRESIEGPAEQTCVSLPLSFARLLSTLVEDRDTVRICTSGDNRYIFQITNLDDSKDLTLATVTSAENFPSEQIMTLIMRREIAQLLI